MCLSGCALLSLGWHVDTGNGEFVAVHVAKNKMDKQKIYPQVFFFKHNRLTVWDKFLVVSRCCQCVLDSLIHSIYTYPGFTAGCKQAGFSSGASTIISSPGPSRAHSGLSQCWVLSLGLGLMWQGRGDVAVN